MSKPGFYFYYGDWKKDVTCLTLDAQAAYLHWLGGPLHQNGGQVTWPITAFASYVGSSEEMARGYLHQLELTNVAIVEWQNDGKTIAKLGNRRMIREAEKDLEIKEKRSEAGKKGACSRWQKCASSSSESYSLNLNSESYKNNSLPGVVAEKPPRSAIPTWPDDAAWLKGFLETEACNLVPTPNETLLDPRWWNSVSETCGGLSLPFLRAEFNRISAWLTENPSRSPAKPTGWKRFIRTWLERAHERERRQANASPRQFGTAKR